MIMKREKMLKKIMQVVCFLCFICACLTGTHKAYAATATSKVPITAYLKGYSTVRTYNAVNGRVTGSIYSSDRCTILNVYSSGWCRVKYPVSGGSRIAYTYSSYFFTNTNFSTATAKPGKNRTVYGKPNLSYNLGTTYSSDSILIIGSSNGNQQILYPVSGGYKMGFISGSINTGAVNTTGTSNTGSYSPVIYNGTNAEIEGLCFDAAYYANTYPDLKAAFGYDSAKLLNHWKTCGIREGRGASPILDLKYYMANNKDLRDAFGSTNYTRAYQHFLKHGYAEFRASSKFYNGDYYRKKYSDLKSYDSKFLVKHYLQYGIKEKRYANTVQYIPGSSISAAAPANASYNVSGNLLTVNGVAMTDYRIGGKYTNSNYAIVNGKSVYMAGSQCCGYARYIAYKLYGCHDKSAPSKFRDVSGYVAAGQLTATKMKSAVQAAGVGAHIRTNGRQHSLAIIGVSDSGFTITDANSDGRNTIRTYTYTWSSYVNSTYGKRGILYIKKYVG